MWSYTQNNLYINGIKQLLESEMKIVCGCWKIMMRQMIYI